MRWLQCRLDSTFYWRRLKLALSDLLSSSVRNDFKDSTIVFGEFCISLQKLLIWLSKKKFPSKIIPLNTEPQRLKYTKIWGSPCLFTDLTHFLSALRGTERIKYWSSDHLLWCSSMKNCTKPVSKSPYKNFRTWWLTALIHVKVCEGTLKIKALCQGGKPQNFCSRCIRAGRPLAWCSHFFPHSISTKPQQGRQEQKMKQRYR